MLGSSRIHMVRPPPSDNLYITGLPEDFTQEDIQKVFGKYGNIVQCKSLGPKYGTVAALVRFASVDEATWVRDNMNGRIPPGLKSPIEVRFAGKPQAPGTGQAGVSGKGTWTQQGT